jgi:hypothetical protein
VRSATGNGGRPGSGFKFDELSLPESEVILRDTAFNAPMFGPGRRGLIGDPEAGGYRWQSRPSSPGNLAAGSSAVHAVRSPHRSSSEIRAVVRTCRIDHEESTSKKGGVPTAVLKKA